ncbi:MAG TPA: hypothetical protein VK459_11090, partial [Polyangiaceae bacterium]|nr:hypothetical protein [Polyangiaceae bacterium]
MAIRQGPVFDAARLLPDRDKAPSFPTEPVAGVVPDSADLSILSEIPRTSGDGRRARDRDAAADDIAADANTTIANAAAKGGTWKQLADERLGPTMALYST